MNRIMRFIVLTNLAAALYFCPLTHMTLRPASAEDATLQLPLKKNISLKSIEKYAQISVKVKDRGKTVTYTGAPLRAVLAEMLPDLKMDSMPEWKALNRRELVLELVGDDGYPGLVSATEIACNTDGTGYLLATKENGKTIEAGVHLICKNDEAHVRWIRQVVGLRLFSVQQK